MTDLKIGDLVKHKPSGLTYQVDGSLSGVVYNDGVQDWVNVQSGMNPIHLYSFPLNELKKIKP